MYELSNYKVEEALYSRRHQTSIINLKQAQLSHSGVNYINSRQFRNAYNLRDI